MNARLLKNAVNATTVAATVDLASNEYQAQSIGKIVTSSMLQGLAWLQSCWAGSRKVGVYHRALIRDLSSAWHCIK